MASRISLLLLFILLTVSVQAQRLPATNLLLFEMNQLNDSIFQFKSPQFLSDFNKTGYNNQPYFMSDDVLYVTVQTPLDTMQSDIYALNLKKQSLTMITATIESEFSPTFIPPRSDDDLKYYFSCIRVEADGQNSQRLWKFPMDRSSNGEPALRTINNIGYHYWIDYRDVLLFLVGDPHQLVIADTRDESTRFVANNIGRCFQELPNGDIAYVQKSDSGNWLIKKINSRTYRTELITATLSDSEDFVVLNDGTIIMAQGSKLYKFNRAIDISWTEIADFSYYGMTKISRLAVNGAENKLVMVIE